MSSGLISRTIEFLAATVVGLAFLVGCSDSKAGGSRPAPTVYLDPALNGAARAGGGPQRETPVPEVRKLTFVAQGTGRRPETGNEQERKLAMSQAAIIDALGDAVAESLRMAGQPSGDFTSELGPRVSITRHGGESGETVLRLMSANGTRTLRTQGGVLQHRPFDLATIQRIMEATDGQYSLLSVEQSAAGDECVASVARYESGATAIAKGMASEGVR